MAAGAPSYSLCIMLPADLDARLRRWAGDTAGTTWPTWGGHITLLPGFVTDDLSRVEDALRAACAGFSAFQVRLNHIVRDAFWDRPGYEMVMLVGEPEETNGGATIRRLRRVLLDAVAGSIHELWPDDAEHPFRPHLSLTTGLLPDAADALAAHAAALDVRFTVDAVWLLEDESGSAAVENVRPLVRLPLRSSASTPRTASEEGLIGG